MVFTMYTITIRYYEELNDFLPYDMRKMDIHFSFTGRRSIKDLIESMGVPHVEVDLILVNGISVDFTYIIADGDRISVYPVFESLDISGITKLRPSPLRDTKFVLDVHLGKLARTMRLLGFDTDYRNERDDDLLAEISCKENRILLTCDRQLLMRRNISRGLIVRSRKPEEQITEVIKRLQLAGLIAPFTRCIECNGVVSGVQNLYIEPASVTASIPPGVLEWCKEFFRCNSCGKIYWKGSHYDKLLKRASKIKEQVSKT